MSSGGGAWGLAGGMGSGGGGGHGFWWGGGARGLALDLARFPDVSSMLTCMVRDTSETIITQTRHERTPQWPLGAQKMFPVAYVTTVTLLIFHQFLQKLPIMK